MQAVTTLGEMREPCTAGHQRRVIHQHTKRGHTVYPDNVLIWPDGFWCFREELIPEFGRDDKYRVILHNTAEWSRILSTPMFSRRPPPSPTDTKH